MNKFFSLLPLWQNKGIAVTRIIVGASVIYHGCEMFDATAMNEYLKWDMFRDLDNLVFKTKIYLHA